ncbi:MULTISPECIES: retinol dehydrogenase [Terrabacteria group]|uniref:retinol dehydrogenase n=1 Tax=Bacillati TaxID=1783272 RepID=UPI003640AEEC
MPFGVNVVVIEPGGIATEWGGIAADFVEETSGNGPYAARADAVAKSLRSEANGNRNSPPSVIADAIDKAVTVAKPKTRHAVG